MGKWIPHLGIGGGERQSYPGTGRVSGHQEQYQEQYQAQPRSCCKELGANPGTCRRAQPHPGWGALSPSSPEAPPPPAPSRTEARPRVTAEGCAWLGGPLRPSPGASLHLPASFHARSGGVTCETLTFTSFTQSRGGLGPLSMTGRCQLALRGAPRGSAGSLRPRPLGLISHACHERSGCVSAFVVRVCFPLQP